MKTKTAYMGLLLAFAIILSYVELLIPFAIGIPGVKLGLANLAVLICLYTAGNREAFLLTTVKAVICGFLFGNPVMILYSLAGAVCSFAIMAAMIRADKFHIPVVSVTGGVLHNIGQVLVAYFMIDTYAVFYYLPFLLIAGGITGVLIGITASLVLPYIQRIIKKGGSL